MKNFSDIHSALNTERTYDITSNITRKAIRNLTSAEVKFLMAHKNSYYIARYASNWLLKFHKNETLKRCKENLDFATTLLFFVKPANWSNKIGEINVLHKKCTVHNCYYYDNIGAEIADIVKRYHAQYII